MKTSYNKMLLPLALLLAISVAACASRLVSERQLSEVQAAPSTDLDEQSTEPKLVIQSGHVNAVTIKLWDAATGKEVRSFAGHTDWQGSSNSDFMATSPDGQYKIIPLPDLRSRHYELGLLQRLLRGVF